MKEVTLCHFSQVFLNSIHANSVRAWMADRRYIPVISYNTVPASTQYHTRKLAVFNNNFEEAVNFK